MWQSLAAPRRFQSRRPGRCLAPPPADDEIDAILARPRLPATPLEKGRQHGVGSRFLASLGLSSRQAQRQGAQQVVGPCRPHRALERRQCLVKGRFENLLSPFGSGAGGEGLATIAENCGTSSNPPSP